MGFATDNSLGAVSIRAIQLIDQALQWPSPGYPRGVPSPYDRPVLFFLVYLAVRRLFRVLGGGSPAAALEVENAVLRHELPVLRRTVKRPPLRRRERLMLAAASALLPGERWSALFVSGFQSDELFERHRPQWLANIRSLERATFGTWTTISSRVAATVRAMLASKEERSLCLDLFRTTRPDLIEALASEDVDILLATARDHRNDWSGHGGVASEREYKRRLEGRSPAPQTLYALAIGFGTVRVRSTCSVAFTSYSVGFTS